jgi:hypothetical protein
MFYPFIIMDIPAGNTLPNPYSNGAAGVGQAVYPWRGRITCSPAAGFTGTVDQTATAASQVNTFLGTQVPGHFSIVTDGSVQGIGQRVNYTGPNTWTFRRMILHYANLCKLAGGVDMFCIGTEMVGATIIRSDTGNTFPFVNGLVTLAAEVKAILPGVEIGYAADWSEYHSYRPGNEVRFNMDPLWSSANIDFIGIDNYMPMSDWRDDVNHLDYLAGVASVYDLDYLKSNIEGGEYYSWFYSSVANRVYQVRTNITDGAHNKPWVFRQKDVRNWWLNSHINRDTSGAETGGATAWTAQSKKIVFTEFGCPAMNKGTNQPNVFYDPKSSESFAPYFSSGARDDVIQQQYIRAFIEYWNANNPTSGVYGGPMIDMANTCYWSYDARPWPTFPTDGTAWKDQENWQYGHWISGRIDAVNVADLLTSIAIDYGVTTYDFSRAYGSCDGYILTNPMSFRAAVDPLASVFNFDIIESGAVVKGISHHEATPVATITLDDLAEAEKEPITFTLRQETELPGTLRLRFMDIFKNFEGSAVRTDREVVQTRESPVIDAPIIIDTVRAQQAVDRLMYTTWARKETSEFSLMPKFLALEPGDVLAINANGFQRNVRIEGIADNQVRQISARSFDTKALTPIGAANRTNASSIQLVISAPTLAILDLPLLSTQVDPRSPYTAGFANPWTGGVAIYKSPTASGYALDSIVDAVSTMGLVINNPVPAGIANQWDNGPGIEVKLLSGSLINVTEDDVLAGDNTCAIQNASGGWEILQFRDATLLAPLTYRLNRLLRGQLGTEDQAALGAPAGARFVLLTGALSQMALQPSDLNRPFNIKYGPVAKDITDPSYRDIVQTFTGRGLKPYSPARVEAIVGLSGDVTLNWLRRTRLSGDQWETVEPPLNEEYERYEIDIIKPSSQVVRTITVTSATTVVYTAAQQTTDTVTRPFTAEVFQISSEVGRGIGRRIVVS